MEPMTRFWIWANEPAQENEAMIYGTPSAVEHMDLRFNEGLPVPGEIPVIRIDRDADSQGILTDNLIAAGLKGLLFSSRLRKLLQDIGVTNFQYFPAVVCNSADGSENHDYQVANVIGCVNCLDKDRSVIDYSPDDPRWIEFIESLSLDTSEIEGLDFLRMGEVPDPGSQRPTENGLRAGQDYRDSVLSAI